jgi:hypothetical protein
MPFAVVNGASLWYCDWAPVQKGTAAESVNVEPLVFLHGELCAVFPLYVSVLT